MKKLYTLFILCLSVNLTILAASSSKYALIFNRNQTDSTPSSNTSEIVRSYLEITHEYDAQEIILDYNSPDSILIQQVSSACKLIPRKFSISYQLNKLPNDISPESWIQRHVATLRTIISQTDIERIIFQQTDDILPYSQDVYYRLYVSLQINFPHTNFFNFPSYNADGYVASSYSLPTTTLYKPWYVFFDVGNQQDAFYRTVSLGGTFIHKVKVSSDGILSKEIKEQLQKFQSSITRYKDIWSYAAINPFRYGFNWGSILTKGNTIYLFLTGVYPTDGKIILQMPGYKLIDGDGKMATCVQYGDMVVVTVPESTFKTSITETLELHFDKEITPIPNKIAKGLILSEKNAVPIQGIVSLQGRKAYYYTPSYCWTAGINKFERISLIYTENEVNHSIILTIDGINYPILLDNKYPNAIRYNQDQPLRTYRKAIKIKLPAVSNRHLIQISTNDQDFFHASNGQSPSLKNIRLWINPIELRKKNN